MITAEKSAWLYLATNKKNGKVYVGQTCYGLSRRKARHLLDARQGRGSLFHRAIRKHGEDAFVFKILAVGPRGGWTDEMEIKLIAAYGSFGRQGYNATAGGGGTKGNRSFLGKKHTPETLKKMRQAKLGKVFSPEHRTNLSASHKGKTHAGSFAAGFKHSEDAKHKMSETRKGVPKTGRGLENILRGCEGRRGVPRSLETRDKISAAILAMPIVKCPHCDVSGRARGGMLRYHFTNCKLAR